MSVLCSTVNVDLGIYTRIIIQIRIGLKYYECSKFCQFVAYRFAMICIYK